MKKISVAVICSTVMLLAPLIALAQSVNTSASVQRSFLAELQSLQQQLSALEATINAMIVAAGGTATTVQTVAATSSPQSTVLPRVGTTLLPPSNLSGDMLTSSLLQALTSASTTSFVIISQATTSSTSSGSGPASPVNIATQLDPTCNSGLWANGAQCNGLYYCGVGVAGGYWSSTACRAQE